MKKHIRSIVGFLALAMMLAVSVLVLSPKARAAAGDVVLLWINVGGQGAAWKGTASGDLVGAAGCHFSPYSGPRLGIQAVSANTTLTGSSAMVVHCTNATAVVTLGNATTLGDGYVQFVKNASGAGNVSIASASTIDGAASINATIAQHRGVYAYGGAWWSFP